MRAAVVTVLLGGLWLFSLLAFLGLDAMAQSPTSPPQPAPVSPSARTVASTVQGASGMELSALQSLLSLASGALAAGILLGASRMRLQRAEERLAENKASMDAMTTQLNQLRAELAAQTERNRVTDRLEKDVRRLVEGFARMKGAQSVQDENQDS